MRDFCRISLLKFCVPYSLLLIWSILVASQVSLAGSRIALTFDDAPRPDGQYFSGDKRTQVLLDKLKKAGVFQTVFFCNTIRFDKKGTERIQAYANAGHLIANHTHSHPDLHEVGPTAFLQNIQKAHSLLKGFAGFTPLFRFPFLREGKTEKDRDDVRVALSRIGYQNGYVTVDNYDWYMDRLLQEALGKGKRINFGKLRKTYLQVLWEGIQFYDALAIETLGRSPNHVLLLHENDLAALFVTDLVAFLKTRGWEVISVKEAYRDPISMIEPDTLTLGQGRVMGIAAASGYQGPFASQWENEGVIEELFEKNAIFESRHQRPLERLSPSNESMRSRRSHRRN